MWVYIVAAVVAALIVVVDQITKFLIVSNLNLYDTFELIPGVLRLNYIPNTGIAMGMLDNMPWIFIPLSLIGIGAIVFYLVKTKTKNPLIIASLSMMLGGGIGNMIDRIRIGYVIDFIDFYPIPIWKYIFNVADSFICIGAGLLIVYLIIELIKESKNERAKRKNSSDGNE